MCGILCTFGNYKSIDMNEYKKCQNIIKQRGPDDFSELEINQGYLCFARLAIMDKSSNGNQPFISDGKYLMCNGEIYNFKELIKTYHLKCSSNSDCEVILKLYEKFGFEDTVKKLYGVFAIVLVDNDKIYLGRDRIGVRPLFLGHDKTNNLFSIASVPSALEFGNNIITEFKPGYALYKKNEDDVYINIYHEQFLYEKITYETDKLYDLVYNTFFESIKKRIITDRPIGCLLSGGLDSSLVASILCNLIGSKNVRTYSIGMKDSIDLHYAKIMANYLGTVHNEIIFTPEEGLAIIPEVIKNIQSYDITTIRASIGMYLVAKYISTNTDDKVIFSGEGSDELLCGYLYFHKAPNDLELEKESKRLVDDLYLYDVLRADRTISSNGLELRVPFLDWNFVNLCMSLSGDIKKPLFRFEKYLLRKSIENKYLLPHSILWRRKDGFSDGVSNLEKPWYKYIQEHVDKLISNEEFNSVKEKFPSKEAYWYKKIFNENFQRYRPEMYYWLPKWSDSKEPSGREFFKII
jgi:asparagine synthase (glutamine-hydrolysing)